MSTNEPEYTFVERPAHDTATTAVTYSPGAIDEDQAAAEMVLFTNTFETGDLHVQVHIDPSTIPGIAEATGPREIRQAFTTWMNRIDPGQTTRSAMVITDRTEPPAVGGTLNLVNHPHALSHAIVKGFNTLKATPAELRPPAWPWWADFHADTIAGMTLNMSGDAFRGRTNEAALMLQVSPSTFGTTNFDHLNIYTGNQNPGCANPLVGYRTYANGKPGFIEVNRRDLDGYTGLVVALEKFVNRFRRDGECHFHITELLAMTGDDTVYTVDGKPLFN